MVFVHNCRTNEQKRRRWTVYSRAARGGAQKPTYWAEAGKGGYTGVPPAACFGARYRLHIEICVCSSRAVLLAHAAISK